ncbi:hypothetical protein J7E93_10445 [Streptomyces sp. ISL-36]|uniref:hypothetical protein n=1 Tax=Streptomyces sp. ISL-36 TaxID=2819182 RepID=UPI001BE51E91|nr:hypothetical protein [Streptomyces sp. ISL-36]MBT2440524.1 hypothetical protein [Streptomyces sp. ISL-36]
MAALIAVILGALILAAVWYDIARLVTPAEKRCPPLARLRGRRAALAATERWCVGLRLRGRIDADTYRSRMSRLACGERRASAGRRLRVRH